VGGDNTKIRRWCQRFILPVSTSKIMPLFEKKSSLSRAHKDASFQKLSLEVMQGFVQMARMTTI